MRSLSLQEYSANQVIGLLKAIPFFNKTLNDNPLQFKTLMQYARLWQADAGDAIITKGEDDRHLYFLLKGNLEVYGDSNSSRSQLLNQISPGEVFGTIAMLKQCPRTATIKNSNQAKHTALVLAIDVVPFENLLDFSAIGLATKLTFYLLVVHTIRWQLERYKMQHSAHPVLRNLSQMRYFTGAKGSQEELEHARKEAVALADILCAWNNAYSAAVPIA